MNELLLINGRIHTRNPVQSLAEAILIRDETIAAIDRPEITALAGPDARAPGLGGRLVLPGFQDAHIHLLSGGTDLAAAAPL